MKQFTIVGSDRSLDATGFHSGLSTSSAGDSAVSVEDGSTSSALVARVCCPGVSGAPGSDSAVSVVSPVDPITGAAVSVIFQQNRQVASKQE